jgi:hypothetical protein
VEVKVLLTHELGSDGQWADITPVERICYLSLADNAFPYTEKKLKALGFNGDFASPDFSEEAKHTGVEWDVRKDSYQGKATEKVELASWGGDAEPAAADKLARMNAIWKSKASSTQRPPGAPVAPPRSSAPTPVAAPAPSRPATPPPAAQRSAPAAPIASATATLAPVTDKQTAWEAYCSYAENAPDLKAWAAAVTGISANSGKSEEQFTPTEWHLVLGSLECPF